MGNGYSFSRTGGTAQRVPHPPSLGGHHKYSCSPVIHDSCQSDLPQVGHGMARFLRRVRLL